MLTYKKIINAPRLVIKYDQDAENPRKWDGNLGYFITCFGYSPDKNDYMERIVKQTGYKSESQEQHIKEIKIAFEDELSKGKVLAIYPVVKYEHGGVSYSLGTKHGFDYSNNGFYIITEHSFKNSGYNKKGDDVFKEGIESELRSYNDWVNGNIYCFTLYDENGELLESVGGFYDIEEIRNYLPEEFKNEKLEEYFIN